MRQLKIAPSGIGRDLHARFDPVQRVDDRETVEAWLLDAIVARAPRRFKADRPGRLVLLAHIEEMAARLKRIERPAKKVDCEAAALRAHDESRAPPVALNLEAHRAVVEGIAFRPSREFKRRAIEPWPRWPNLGALFEKRRDGGRGDRGA